MSEEERLGVWRAQPEAGAAWDKLSAELDDATATDPLAAGWAAEEEIAAAAEEEQVPVAAAAAEAVGEDAAVAEEEGRAAHREQEVPVEQGPAGGGGAPGGAGGATTATAARPLVPTRASARLRRTGLEPAQSQQARSTLAAPPAPGVGAPAEVRSCGTRSSQPRVAQGVRKLAHLTLAFEWVLLPPWSGRCSTALEWIMCACLTLTQVRGAGVALLRWSTQVMKHQCALLARDPRTGQEVEKPYHEGMEQELPERFKVKFLARMHARQDPVASVPPGRSFLFLHHRNRNGAMPLVGVVEAAQLAHRSAVPGSEPHVYHLHVRRLQGQGTAAVTYKGVESDAGAMLRNTLVHHFGVGVDAVNEAPVLLRFGHALRSGQAVQVLHLPDGTPRFPT